MAGVALFGAQIAAPTRDIFAAWKIVPTSNINHYHKTHLGYFIFYFHFGHLFGAQIAAPTRDIFAAWKIVPTSNINHYHKTHLGYFIFYFHFGHLS